MYGVLGVLRMVDRFSIFKTLSPAVHLHSCKGLYRTERRTASLRREVQLMVICTDILQLIFPFFFPFLSNFQSDLEWLGPRKVKSPFIVNWFVASKETRENQLGTGTWVYRRSAVTFSHCAVWISGSLEPELPNETRPNQYNPIGTGGGAVGEASRSSFSTDARRVQDTC